MHTYLPSYCRGPSAKAKDLTTKSLAKEEGVGKGSDRGSILNVEKIAKNRAQEQSFKSNWCEIGEILQKMGVGGQMGKGFEMAAIQH